MSKPSYLFIGSSHQPHLLSQEFREFLPYSHPPLVRGFPNAQSREEYINAYSLLISQRTAETMLALTDSLMRLREATEHATIAQDAYANSFQAGNMRQRPELA